MRFKGYWVSQAGQHHGGRPLRSSTNAWARTISPQERFQGGRGNTPGFSFGVYRNASWIILRWGDVEGNLTRDRDHHSTHPGHGSVSRRGSPRKEGRIGFGLARNGPLSSPPPVHIPILFIPSGKNSFKLISLPNPRCLRLFARPPRPRFRHGYVTLTYPLTPLSPYPPHPPAPTLTLTHKKNPPHPPPPFHHPSSNHERNLFILPSPRYYRDADEEAPRSCAARTLTFAGIWSGSGVRWPPRARPSG